MHCQGALGGRGCPAAFSPPPRFSPRSWFSRCVFQDRGQELVDGLKVCLQGQSPATRPGLGSGGLPELSRRRGTEKHALRARGFVAAALRAWNSCNEYMPSRVIVYRDGVGDGQLKTLVNYEVPQFLDCLKSVGRGYK